MATSRADKDRGLRLVCEAAIEGTREKVVMAIQAGSHQGAWEKSGKLGRSMAKPNVLAVCVKETGQQTSTYLRVFQYSTAGVLQPTKLYKFKHLSKMEVMSNDPSGCTFTLGFDNMRNQRTSLPQWTVHNIDDRNLFLLCILKTCKDIIGRIPRVFGVDIVEMALWLKEKEVTACDEENSQDGAVTSIITERDLKVTVQNELASHAEEEDMQALLDFYVIGISEAEAFSEVLKRELHALETANAHAILTVEPLIDEVLQGLDTALSYACEMDEWLSIFNVKLKYMREDIESVEALNNSLALQSVNGEALAEELDRLLEKLSVTSEHASCLIKGSFEEANMPNIIEACESLFNALTSLEAPKLDPACANMRAVKVKKVELKKLKSTFVGRASEFFRNYLTSVVDHMIRDKRQQSTCHDHNDLQRKCRTYAGLLLHLKRLDRNCLGPLRKSYCSAFNLLLRRESRDFAKELRNRTKLSRSPSSWFDASAGCGENINNTDTSAVSYAYAKMLTTFIPHIEQEVSFFAQFMCFDVSTPGRKISLSVPSEANNVNLVIVEVDDVGKKAELAALDECLQELLEGIQEDFYAIIEWGHKIDPLRSISMHGMTEQILSDWKANGSEFVNRLLSDLQSRISALFSQFVEELCHHIEITEQSVQPVGVHSYIPRFAAVASCMEQCVQRKSRDLVDKAYAKIGSTLFMTLNKIARSDPKYGDLYILENYAAFQTSLYELANVVPALARLYHQASDAYEQACTRHVNMIIYIQFEQLFQYSGKIEDLILASTPEEIPSRPGMSIADLRRVLKTSLDEIDNSISAMYKGLQRNLTLRELLPSLRTRCKREFVDKYEAVVDLVAKIYPTEIKWMPSVGVLRELLASIEEAYFL